VKTALPAREAVRRIIERTDLDVFTERVLDTFWDRPEYRSHRPPREEVREWVRWNIDLVVRWLVYDQRPTEEELARYRARARAQASEGMPADVVPANFRRGARFTWTQLLAAAREEERPALLESADLLFEFIDQVSELFSDAYETTAVLPEEERLAQELLSRLCARDVPTGEDQQLAERVGFELREAYRPFALSAPTLSGRHHAGFAARLRVAGALAASEGRRVVGLAHAPVAWGELDLGQGAIRAEGATVSRPGLGESLDELRAVVELAVRDGRTGAVGADDYVPDLLLRRSPRLAARLRARVYGRLTAADPELARTLDTLIANDFDRGATAAALPVHRNTLGNRLARIRSITGLDADSAEGRGLLWLAWRVRA
jgi:hypothetical protein